VVNGTVRLDYLSPEGGTVVRLVSSSSDVTVPAEVVVPAGESSASFEVRAVPGAAEGKVRIDAIYNNRTSSKFLDVHAW
jgi:hypothetical protein